MKKHVIFRIVFFVILIMLVGIYYTRVFLVSWATSTSVNFSLTIIPSEPVNTGLQNTGNDILISSDKEGKFMNTGSFLTGDILLDTGSGIIDSGWHYSPTGSDLELVDNNLETNLAILKSGNNYYKPLSGSDIVQNKAVTLENLICNLTGEIDFDGEHSNHYHKIEKINSDVIDCLSTGFVKYMKYVVLEPIKSVVYTDFTDNLYTHDFVDFSICLDVKISDSSLNTGIFNTGIISRVKNSVIKSKDIGKDYIFFVMKKILKTILNRF